LMTSAKSSKRSGVTGCVSHVTGPPHHVPPTPDADPPAVIAKVLMLGRAAGDRWP
jgi:hypothetical protein